MTIAVVLGSKGREVETIPPGTTVGEAVALLGEKRIGALPVTSESGVIGVFSERDVIYCLQQHGAEVLDWPVDNIMSAPAITVTPDESVLAALAMMTQRRIRHLPVVEGSQLVGLVSIGDLVKHRIDRIESEASAMRAYIAGDPIA